MASNGSSSYGGLVSNIKEVGTTDMSGGYVTVRPTHQLDEGQGSDMVNMDPFVNFGAITRRLGHRYYIETPQETVTNLSSGLFEFIKSSGTNQLFMGVNTSILELSAPATKTTRYAKNAKTVEEIAEDTGGLADHQVIFKVTGHGYASSDTVIPYGATTPTTFNENTYTILVIDADHFGLVATGALVINTFNTGVGFVHKTNGVSASNVGDLNFCTFQDQCIVVSPNITTLKSTGAAFTALGGTPPSNAKFIAAHKNRVFIAHHSIGGGTEYRSRVNFCALGDSGDWTTITGASTDAGNIDVGKDDGDVITGMASLGNVLIVFKNNSTWMIQGSGPDNFTVRPISNVVGCIAPNSIVIADQFAIFLSELGVYTVTANGNGVVRMSYNIQPSIDGYTRAQRVAAVAVRYKTQYRLSITSGGVQLTYLLDYVYGAWARHAYATFVTRSILRQDGTLLWQGGGTYDNADVIQGEVGHYDEYKPVSHASKTQIGITAYWFSKDYDFGTFVNRKVLHDIVVLAQPLASESVSIVCYINGVAAGTALTFDLTPVGSETQRLFKTGRHQDAGVQKNFIKFKFQNISTPSSTGAPVILGYSATAEIYDRENG